jgi:hypothetical protein
MTTATAVILIVVVLAVLIVGFALYRRERSRKLRAHFGPEYERTLHQYGSETKAEEALASRQRRMEKIQIRPLTEHQRDQFADQWHGIQSRFVDDPSESIREADRLVMDVMAARGYPMADFDRRAEDISVDHPHVVSNYRKAHDIALKNGQASTENLREGLVCYRRLFDELLEAPAAPRR